MRKLLLFFTLFQITACIADAQLKVLPSGYVGAGTTEPISGFHLFGTNYLKSTVILERSEAGHGPSILQRARKSAGGPLSSNYTLGSMSFQGANATATPQTYGTGASIFSITTENWSTSANGAKLSFYTTNNGTTGASERMVIEPDGDVCVGTSSSINKGKVYIYQNTNLAGIRVYKNYSGVSYNILSEVSDTSCKSIVSQYGGGDKFCVWGNGKTNIGFSNQTPWMLAVNGNAFSWGQWLGSDISFKQNITNIDSPIDKLNQITGKKYQYNSAAFPENNFPKGYTYGVIAQEVQAVLPELVMADSAGYLSVNYNGLIPILIEAIKSQNATLTQQGQEIENLKIRLDECCKPASPGTINGGN